MQRFVSLSSWNSRLLPLFAIFFCLTNALAAQPFSYDRRISWDNPKSINLPAGEKTTIMSFSGAATFSETFGMLPVYIEAFPLFTANDSIISLRLEKPVFEETGMTELAGIEFLTDSLNLRHSQSFNHKKPFLNISFVPLKKGPDGKILKLVSFRLVIEVLPAGSTIPLKSVRTYAENSVLAAGKWFRMMLNNTGIYKLSYDELVAMDAGFAGADPRMIRIYGNGGGMLPEKVTANRIDDLRELSIVVTGEADGSFDQGDYVLFYGESPDKWTYNATDLVFNHRKNVYSDYSGYFITYGQGNGKRLTPVASVTYPASDHVNRFNDYAFYEHDDISLLKTGREWFDKENFEFTLTRNYGFSFPDIDISSPVTLKASVAARSTSGNTNFTISANGSQVMTMTVAGTGGDTYDIFAKTATNSQAFPLSGSALDIKIVYSKNGHEAIGWLNYLEINLMRALKLTSGQMNFRSVTGTGSARITEFTLGSNGQTVAIWDVTDPGNIGEIQATKSGNNYIFRLATDTLREFVAYDGTSFHSITSWSGVENQNLHATGTYDYIIITHPTFLSEAEQLAQFHRDLDQMSVFITTPEKIYNEFSSGVQDLTAIRDFTRMIYERAQAGSEPKYLLLFGDASFDYKERIKMKENFVPCYQSWESLNPLSTYATDDFFGMMENNDSLDIGVGRFPVTNLEQARSTIEKIRHYTANTDSVKTDWRNMLSFVADDEDGEQYMSDAEVVTGMIQVQNPCYNIDKIYIDAYQQISTPGGARSPEVNDAIDLRIAKGTLMVNYIGHGGEKGWAHERILEIPDIIGWTNFDKLPVFVTATCEFTRYDDPDWVSAGEWVFLNPHGGGIALFTTTRPTYADANLTLTRNFYLHAFSKTNGQFPKMGDIIVKAKNKSGTGVSTRKFILIGDPALKINYPNYGVVTTAIHSEGKTEESDTLKALSTVTISGEVRDDSGNKMSGFNGTVYPSVYDKVSEVTTLANDPNSTPFTFLLRKNIIYKGKVDVTDGVFSFTFIVPKDIAYQYGSGRISYYARSSETDAAGYDNDVIVGGFDENAVPDDQGPLVRLFMNDTNFISGGMTDQNPKMLALTSDEAGINTIGNGIGHDITVVLDDDYKNQRIVNDYYTSDQNTFRSGTILYPLFNLSDGWHTLRLKVWDVYNNSSDASISFVVASSAELALDHIFNYPNPFKEFTTFSFEYNRPSTELDVSISIYNMSGQLVTTINEKLFSNGYRSNTIRWDGTTKGGWKITTGNYIYDIRVTTPEGETISKASRLVVIR